MANVEEAMAARVSFRATRDTTGRFRPAVIEVNR